MLDENDKQWIKAELKTELDSVLNLVLNEIGRRADEQTARWESIDARLKLQAGLIQSGSRAITRLSEFAENTEVRWLDLDKRVRAIEDRLRGAA
ncbi:MAG TPA: hypothetical protein VG345_07180 [Bryobacteraceae bacterium]|nr:hypothetical protein [Bryobacteraceae bacterium]